MTEHEWYLLCEGQKAEIARLEDELDEMTRNYEALDEYCERLQSELEERREC